MPGLACGRFDFMGVTAMNAGVRTFVQGLDVPLPLVWFAPVGGNGLYPGEDFPDAPNISRQSERTSALTYSGMPNRTNPAGGAKRTFSGVNSSQIIL